MTINIDALLEVSNQLISLASREDWKGEIKVGVLDYVFPIN